MTASVPYPQSIPTQTSDGGGGWAGLSWWRKAIYWTMALLLAIVSGSLFGGLVAALPRALDAPIGVQSVLAFAGVCRLWGLRLVLHHPMDAGRPRLRRFGRVGTTEPATSQAGGQAALAVEADRTGPRPSSRTYWMVRQCEL